MSFTGNPWRATESEAAAWKLKTSVRSTASKAVFLLRSENDDQKCALCVRLSLKEEKQMKLLTFRKRGALMTRVGVLSISGEVIDLTAAYASHLHEKGESNPIRLAETLIPMDMVEFIGGGRTFL